MRTPSEPLFVIEPRSERMSAKIHGMSIIKNDGNSRRKVDYVLFKKGKSVAGSTFKIVCIATSAKGSDLFSNMFNLPLVNAMVRAVLQTVPNIEYVDFELNVRGKPVPHDYKLANVVGVRNIVDWKKTRCERYSDGTIREVTKLVLLKSHLPRVDLFWTDIPRRLVCKRNIAKILLDKKISGIRIFPIEKYKW